MARSPVILISTAEAARRLGASRERVRQLLELGVGDLFSLQPDVETTWHITTPFKEMWVLAPA